MATRGRKIGTNNMERYTFRIKNDLLEKIKKYAEENNTTVSEIIRECLEQKINKPM